MSDINVKGGGNQPDLTFNTINPPVDQKNPQQQDYDLSLLTDTLIKSTYAPPTSYTRYANAPSLPPAGTPNSQNWTDAITEAANREFDRSYTNNLNEYAQAHNLSQGQLQTILAAHQNPNDTNVPLSARLINAQIQDQAYVNVSQQYNLPSNWTPGRSNVHNQVNGNADSSVKNGSVDNDSAYDDLAQLLPSDIQQQLSIESAKPEGQRDPAFVDLDLQLQLFSTGTSFFNSVSQVNGTPDTNQKNFPNNFINNVLNTSEETINTFSLLIQGNPALSSSDRVIVGDFIKKITSIISQLKQFLYQVESDNSATSQRNTEGEKDAHITEIKLEVAELQKMKEQQDQQNKLSLALKILGPILIVLAVVATILTGGLSSFLLVAITVATVAVSIADSCTGFIGNAVDKALSAITASMADGPAKDAVKAIIIIVLIAVVIAITRGGGANALGRLVGKEVVEDVTRIVVTDVAVQVLSSSSSILQTGFASILKSLGADDKTAEIVAAVLTVLLTLLALFSGAGGAKPAKLPPKLDKLEKAFSKIAPAIRALSGAAQIASGVTQAVLQIQIGKTIKEVDDLEAALAEIKAIILIYQKLIKSLQGELSNTIDFIKAISQATNKMFDDLNAITTSISQAA